MHMLTRPRFVAAFDTALSWATLALMTALGLAACANSFQLTPAAQTEITKAYNAVCPGVTSGALDPLAAGFNARVQSAYAAAKTICAQGAPTNLVVAGLDILSVEPLLAPWLARVKL